MLKTCAVSSTVQRVLRRTTRICPSDLRNSLGGAFIRMNTPDHGAPQTLGPRRPSSEGRAGHAQRRETRWI
jgi:hypothetical protein